MFWRAESRSISKDEAKKYRSPEQTGARLVAAVHAWVAEANARLTYEQQAWLCTDVDSTPPAWLDPTNPDHAIHELHRLIWRGPHARPDWWALSEDQDKAIGVILALRALVDSSRGLPPRQAVVLIDRTFSAMHAIDEAHLQPWEHVAAVGENRIRQLSEFANRANEERERDAKARQARWLAEDERLRTERPAIKSKIRRAELIRERLGATTTADWLARSLPKT